MKSRGDIARAYLYMSKTYHINLSKYEKKIDAGMGQT